MHKHTISITKCIYVVYFHLFKILFYCFVWVLLLPVQITWGWETFSSFNGRGVIDLIPSMEEYKKDQASLYRLHVYNWKVPGRRTGQKNTLEITKKWLKQVEVNKQEPKNVEPSAAQWVWLTCNFQNRSKGRRSVCSFVEEAKNRWFNCWKNNSDK